MSPNQTQSFLGDESAWPAAKAQMSDVQGLWGGRRIFVYGNGRVVVQSVAEEMYEQRYEFVLPAVEVRRLLGTCIEKDFMTIREDAGRMGIPDEAWREITLINAAGERRTVARWEGEKDSRFDAVYNELLHIEALIGNTEPIYSGPFEWEYVPEGF